MARYALVIGIAEYGTGSFRSLDTPVHNANAIAAILDQHGDFNQVRRLPFRRERGQPELGQVIRKPLPHDQLVQELQQFLDDADGSDVLIYYSGHGFTKVDALSQTPEGYLAPSDCQLEINAAGQVIAQKNGVSLFGLNELIKQHRFSSLVVILDCCNSGAFLESAMVRRDATVFGYQLDYYLITACRSSSKSYEGEEYSLLTQAVLKGLAPENALPLTGRISGDRLFDVIGNELHNKRQEPIRMGWGRMITLVRYAPQSPTSESPTVAFNPANPYMGLKPFDRDQADYFFGRDIAVRALLDRLSENRFLAVLGPSGSGKSSLVRAGLFPELESDRLPGSQTWALASITPGQYPLQELNRVLDQHRHSDRPLLLFVDQFEELFTLCPNEAEQRQFIQRLDQESSRTDTQTRIIIAMRGDFLDRCAKFQESADLINSTAPTTYMVTPLTEARLVGELEEAITCPASLHGVSLTSDLTSRIVDEVINQPGAMPLLQYALRELWENSISASGANRQLTLAGYAAIGGVKGALQRWADQFYENLSPADQTFVREMVGELVQIGDEGEVTRRRASWERLREMAASSQQLERIAGQLIYQRLLVADDKTVEVAHEALLQESRLIQGWIEDNRDSIRLQQRLEAYRREWQEHDHSENYLLDAGRLAAIDDWIANKQPRLIKIDQKFIEQSREKRDRLFQAQLEQERKLKEIAEAKAKAEEEARQKAEEVAIAESETRKATEKSLQAEQKRLRSEKQRTRFAIGSAIVVAAIATLAGYQWRAADRGQIEALITSSQAKFSLNRDTMDSLIEAMQAGQLLRQSFWFRNDPQLQTDVMEVLAQSSYWVRERNRLQGHTNYVGGVSFSPDGQIIATASDDKTVKLWNLAGQEIRTLTGHTEPVVDVSFSPDGQTIGTASMDGTARLWGQNGNFLRELKGHTGTVWQVSFSPDQQTIATASSDQTVKLWDYQGNHKNTLRGHTDRVFTVQFQPPKGELIATAGRDQTIRFWTLAGQSSPPLKGHTNWIFKVNFSPNGQTLASASYDKTAALWDVVTRSRQAVLKGHQAEVSNAVFLADGQTLLTSGLDSTIRLWNHTDVLAAAVKGHQGGVMSVAVSPVQSNRPGLFASTSYDKTIKLWQRSPWLKVFTTYQGKVYSSDTSLDGRWIVAAKDNQVELWNIQTGQIQYSLKGHDLAVGSVSFSPDNKVVASASDDGNIKLWNVQTGQLLHILVGHRDAVKKVSFSPDGTIIVSGSSDKTIRLWTPNGVAMGVLGQHETTVSGIAINRDSTLIATVDESGVVKLWKWEGKQQKGWQLQQTWQTYQVSIRNLRFSHDGKLVATAAEDNTVKVWNLEGQQLATLEGHTAGVWGLAFSPDGQMIATGSDDHTIRLWSYTGKLLARLNGHQGAVNSVNFSSDGKALVSGSSDHTIGLWNIENMTLNGLMGRSCNWIYEYLNTKPQDLPSQTTDSLIEACKNLNG
ncbi:MAG: caspase family protein [Leptolyngbyaceae cyanobacterium bins.349]|nr:caspase family protein [Leptolyngbyaceae cyanobacterium bins.349]